MMCHVLTSQTLFSLEMGMHSMCNLSYIVTIFKNINKNIPNAFILSNR